jgi:hypothetical protein
MAEGKAKQPGAAMTVTRSLAAAQTIPKRGDVEANLKGHIRLLQAAAEEQAQVLVLPELWLTGYELDLVDDLAFSYNITLIVGAPVRIEPRFHIWVFILSSDRSVDFCTKHRLGAFSLDASSDGIVSPAEATVFHASRRNPLLRFDGHTAAVAVCTGVGRPSLPKEEADRRAKNYLASMFVIPTELKQDTARLREYAVQYSMAAVFAIFGGLTGGLPSGGSSAIVSEKYELLVQLRVTGVGIAVAFEVDSG